jgi:hypothetical protein
VILGVGQIKSMNKIVLFLMIISSIGCASRQTISKDITVKVKSSSFVSIQSKREYKERLENYESNGFLWKLFNSKPHEPIPVRLTMNNVRISIGSMVYVVNSNESIIRVNGYAGDMITIVDDNGNSENVCELSDKLKEIWFVDGGILTL